MDKQSRSYYRIICSVIATCTIFMLAFRVALSLVIDIGLPNAGDSAFLYYLSWLGSEGFVPYRDMYDTSFPGTFLVYGLITGLTGYTDVAFRLTDLAVLLLVAALTWRLLGRVSRSGAVISALCFADYFLANPTLALQRDYLGLVLVLTSLVLMVDAPPDRRWRMLFAGVLLALAAAIKPHLLIGAPVIWWYGSNGLRGNRLLLLLMLGGTMLLVWCVFAAVMYLQGALLSFMDMVSNFLPLYMQMDGDINETTWRLPGVWHLLDSVLYVTHIPELVISVTVLLAAMVNANLRRHWKIALALWLLTMAYRLYVLIGMKGRD